MNCRCVTAASAAFAFFASISCSKGEELPGLVVTDQPYTFSINVEPGADYNYVLTFEDGEDKRMPELEFKLATKVQSVEGDIVVITSRYTDMRIDGQPSLFGNLFDGSVTTEVLDRHGMLIRKKEGAMDAISFPVTIANVPRIAPLPIQPVKAGTTWQAPGANEGPRPSFTFLGIDNQTGRELAVIEMTPPDAGDKNKKATTAKIWIDPKSGIVEKATCTVDQIEMFPGLPFQRRMKCELHRA